MPIAINEQDEQFLLTDDGSLDTVFECQTCCREERFNFANSEFEGTYDEFIDDCREDLAENHFCCDSTICPDCKSESDADSLGTVCARCHRGIMEVNG